MRRRRRIRRTVIVDRDVSPLNVPAVGQEPADWVKVWSDVRPEVKP